MASPTTQPEVSNQKLTELLAATDELMGNILRQDTPETYRTVARSLSMLLNAESCSVFLVSQENEQDLELVAQYSRGQEFSFDPVTLRIQETPKGGFTGALASRAKACILTGDQIVNDPCFAGKPADFLRSGKTFSLVAAPLLNRKGRLLGLIKVQNRLSPGLEPMRGATFGPVDLRIAVLFADKVVLLLESLFTFRTVQKLVREMDSALSLNQLLDYILKEGLVLLGADRGDIAWWSNESLILRTSRGETQLQCGGVVAETSVMMQVWTTGKSQIIPDVREHPNYWKATDKTKSEIAVRFEHASRPVGVINFESYKANYFDQRDLNILGMLSEHATMAAKIVEKETGFRWLVSRLADETQLDLLKELLVHVQTSHHMECSLVYAFDNQRRVLACVCANGCDNLANDPGQLLYAEEQIALATKVFKSREAYYSPDPKNDNHVNQAGMERFGITGPLLGLPLTFAGATVGVMVVWSRIAPENCSRQLEQNLQPLARIAAATLATLESQRRHVRFLTAAFHNLRTPIHSVAGLVQQLSKKRLGSDAAEEYLEMLLMETGKLRSLAHQIGLVARPMRMSRFDLRLRVSEMIRVFQVRGETEHVTIDAQLPSTACMVVADPEAIDRVVENLVDNAFVFSDPGQTITIKFDCSPNSVKLAVIDQGPGVMPADVSVVFEEFQSRRPAGKPPSSGLGLPISRRVAEQHGGRLDYTPGEGGTGSCFTLELPRSQKAVMMKEEVR